MIQRVFSLVMTDITGLGDHFAGPQVSLLDNFDPIVLKLLNDAGRLKRTDDIRLRKLYLLRTDLKMYSSLKEDSYLGPDVTRRPVVKSENAGTWTNKGRSSPGRADEQRGNCGYFRTLQNFASQRFKYLQSLSLTDKVYCLPTNNPGLRYTRDLHERKG